jgi:transcriptional regulator with XRE-family HTH domain
VQRGVNQTLITAFGKNLAKLRKSKNMTQEDLADVADINLAQIGKIEAGLINTTLNTLHLLAKGLGVTLKDLMDFKLK